MARLFAPALHGWTRVMYPVIIAGDGLAKWTPGLFGIEIRRSWTEDGEGGERIESPRELRRALRDLLARGPIPGDRREEVVAAFQLGERPVSEIMAPRGDTVALRAGRPVDESLGTLADHPHVRFPLVAEALEDIRGIVYVPALFGRLDDLRAGRIRIEDLAAPPVRIEPALPVAAAIDRFQEERQEMALVFDGDRVVGLLTPTDASEAITGQLEDPLDRAEEGAA